MKHLQSHLYYSDLYDRHTVEQCRRTEQSFGKTDTPLPKGGKVSKKEAEAIKKWAKEWYL